MNLFKIALPILFAAQSISAEDNSASAIRELIAEVKDLKASHKTEIDALKAEIATLKKSSSNSAPKSKNNVRRNQEEPPAMPEIPLDISDLTEGDMEDIISSVGADEQLSGLLYGIIHTVNKLVGLAKCVSYEKYFDEDEDACIIGSEYVDNTYIFAHEDVIIDAPDDVFIEANDEVHIEAYYYLGLYGMYTGIGAYYDLYMGAEYIFSESYMSWTWTDYTHWLNGVVFPNNGPIPLSAPLHAEGNKPESDGVNERNATTVKARFDAMMAEKHSESP